MRWVGLGPSSLGWTLPAALAVTFAMGCGAGRSGRSDSATAFDSRTVGGSASTSAARESGVEVGLASYYSRHLAGHRTANGERYDPAKMTAAHRSLPFGSWVEVRRMDGRRAVVRINDRGPFVRGRIIDVSQRAASALGLLREGYARVEVRVVPKVADARQPGSAQRSTIGALSVPVVPAGTSSSPHVVPTATSPSAGVVGRR